MVIEVYIVLAAVFSHLAYKCDITFEDSSHCILPFLVSTSLKDMNFTTLVFHTL